MPSELEVSWHELRIIAPGHRPDEPFSGVTPVGKVIRK